MQIASWVISQVHTSPQPQLANCLLNTLCWTIQIQFNEAFPKLASDSPFPSVPQSWPSFNMLIKCISSQCYQVHKSEPWLLTFLHYFPYPRMHVSPINFAFKSIVGLFTSLHLYPQADYSHLSPELLLRVIQLFLHS